jgi:3-phosphoshikimate 1-carboxyvinyltransferase
MTRVNGAVHVPGDKSISHRALMLGALGDGPSRVTGILESADVQSTAGVLRALGADIPTLSDDFTIHGVGVRGLATPHMPLDCGNSGTTTRLMAGIVAGSDVTATFVGDGSLSRRPMGRVARPLRQMGASVDLPSSGGLPMTIRGGDLSSIDWTTEVASAQIKSAILLAAAVGGVEAAVDEPNRTRDYTERMLAARGADIEVEGTRVRIGRTTTIAAMDTEVPGDPSSAAFFAALGALAAGGVLTLPRVGVNETRIGFLTALRRMGASVDFSERADVGGEVVATIVISGGHHLHGTTVHEAEVASMIDELPLLACVATRAKGETRITGAAELRVKESDRISAVVSNLRAIGADAEELPDGMIIRGSEAPLSGAVETHADHRLAMAFGVLGAVTGNAIAVDDPQCVAVSYPGFWDDLARAVAAS